MMFLRSFAICAVFLVTLQPAILAQSSDKTQVEVRILDILLERGLIDEATYNELRQLALEQHRADQDLDLLSSRLQRMQASEIVTSGGKPGKLRWSTPDDKWSLGIKGRIQVQADIERGEDANRKADNNTISVKRARLAFTGKAGGDNLSYKLEFDAPTQSSANKGTKDFKVTDAWLNWSLNDSVDVKAGQTKFPFGREVHRSSSKLTLVGESSASKEFAPDREPLVLAYGSVGDDDFFQWWAAASNGDGQSLPNQDGQDGSGSTGIRRGVRVVFNPLGAVKKDMSAFQTVKDGGVKLAVGGSIMENSDQPFDGDGDGTAGDARFNSKSMGYEAQLFVGPLAFMAEHFERDSDNDAGVADANDKGSNVQAGLLFGEDNDFEVVVRRAIVDLDFGSKVVESTLGFNIYNDKHNSKWAFDISDIENKDTADKDKVRGRAQYQLIF